MWPAYREAMDGPITLPGNFLQILAQRFRPPRPSSSARIKRIRPAPRGDPLPPSFPPFFSDLSHALLRHLPHRDKCQEIPTAALQTLSGPYMDTRRTTSHLGALHLAVAGESEAQSGYSSPDWESWVTWDDLDARAGSDILPPYQDTEVEGTIVVAQLDLGRPDFSSQPVVGPSSYEAGLERRGFCDNHNDRCLTLPESDSVWGNACSVLDEDTASSSAMTCWSEISVLNSTETSLASGSRAAHLEWDDPPDRPPKPLPTSCEEEPPLTRRVEKWIHDFLLHLETDEETHLAALDPSEGRLVVASAK